MKMTLPALSEGAMTGCSQSRSGFRAQGGQIWEGIGSDGAFRLEAKKWNCSA